MSSLNQDPAPASPAPASPQIPVTSGAARPIDVLVCTPWLDKKTGLAKPAGTGEAQTLDGFADLADAIEEQVTEGAQSRASTAGLDEHADRAERALRVNANSNSLPEPTAETIEHARRCKMIDVAKGGLTLLVPGAFKDSNKKKEKCEYVSAYFGDFDEETEETWAAAVARLEAAGVAWCAFGSPKDGIPKRIEDPARHLRRRLILATSRDMAPREAERMQRIVPSLLGLTVDGSTFDASRGFYVGIVDERIPYADGNPSGVLALDVDAILAAHPEPSKAEGKRKADARPVRARFAGASPDAKSRRCPVGVDAREHAIDLARTAPPAVQGEQGHTSLFNVACDLVIGLALDPADALAILWDEYNPRCSPPWDEADRKDFDRKVLEEAPKCDREPGYLLAETAIATTTPTAISSFKPVSDFRLLWTREHNKDVAKPHVENARRVLETHDAWGGRISLDTFTGRILALDTPIGFSGEWGDVQTTQLVSWCIETLDLPIGFDVADRAINLAAWHNRRNVLQDWLRALREKWDGFERIPTMLETYFGAAPGDAYTRAVSTAFVMSLVARAMDPGCKADCMPVFEGTQGKRKSSACAALVRPEWFTDEKIAIGDKDGLLNIQGKWLVEVAELAAFGRKEVEEVKAFLSRRIDRYRAPYERRASDHPRQCILAGTTNADRYLQDPTGNRRFWPVRLVGTIDVDAIERNRELLFAEGLARYELGSPGERRHWLEGEDEILALGEQGERDVNADDPWTAGVVDFLRLWEASAQAPAAAGTSGPFSRERVIREARARGGFTTGDVLSWLGVKVATQDKRSETRVGFILMGQKYVRRRVRKDGGRLYFYERLDGLADQPGCS